MVLPNGNTWVVVERHVRDTTSRGTIVRRDLTEKGARRVAAQLNRAQLSGGYSYWAIPRTEY